LLKKIIYLKKFIILFVTSLLFYGCNQSKNNANTDIKKIDSVYYFLKKSRDVKLPDSLRHIALGKSYELIINDLKTFKNRDTLFNISYKYYELKDWKNFSKSINKLYGQSVLYKDSTNIAKSLRYKANYFKRIEIYDSSFFYYSKAEKIYLKLNDKSNYANILYNKGIVQFKINDFYKAELSLFKAYSIFKNSGENEKLYGVLNELGLVCNESKQYEKAIDYLNEALRIVEKYNLNENHEKVICLSNIAYVFQCQKAFKKAIDKYKELLKNKEIKDGSPELYSNIIDNLAICKFQIKDYDNLPNLFYESLKIRKKLNNSSTIILSLIHLSEYFKASGDIIASEKYAEDAVKIAKQTKNTIDYLIALQQLSNVNEKYMSKYAKDYSRINDSLQIVERNSKDSFTRIQLETEEIIKENDVLENRNRNLLYVFVITFILVALLFVVRAQRARTRELLFKQNQQKANEEIFNLMMSQQSIIDESRNKEKKRLAQDLHDGVLGRMFGLRLNLDSLNSSIEADAVQKRIELLNELKTIEQDIREISHDLNREKLVLINNFVSIVHNLLEEQKSLHEANVEYQIDTKIDWDKIGNAIKINMYRILQEGLQNINKYANAKNINVDISGDKESVYLKIQDDGIGFDVNKKSKGIGMQNMISRTHDCQGIIDINSKKGEGTRIIITVPIETKPLIEEQT
jgi:signal transduction histidine kinase